MEDTFLRKGVFYFARQKVGQIGINTYENVLTIIQRGQSIHCSIGKMEKMI